MTQSGNDLSVYTELKETLSQLMEVLKKIDKRSLPQTDLMGVAFFEASIKKLIKRCDAATDDPVNLCKDADKVLESFSSRFLPKKELDNTQAGVKKIAMEIVKSDVNLEEAELKLTRVQSGELHVMTMDDETSGAEVEHTSPLSREHHVMQYDEEGDDEEVKSELVSSPRSISFLNQMNSSSPPSVLEGKLESEDVSTIFLMVKSMLDEELKIINKFIPSAKDKDRKVAAETLSKNLGEIQAILNDKNGDLSIKIGAVKMIKGHFDTAAKESSKDGYNIAKPSKMGAIKSALGSKKVSATDIFARWKKDEAPLASMVKVLDTKLRAIMSPRNEGKK
jgi:hypothetical protein